MLYIYSWYLYVKLLIYRCLELLRNLVHVHVDKQGIVHIRGMLITTNDAVKQGHYIGLLAAIDNDPCVYINVYTGWYTSRVSLNLYETNDNGLRIGHRVYGKIKPCVYDFDY